MYQKSIDYTSGSLRVAVVGGGISGIVAAHLISRKHNVTLIEKEPRLGGHTYTSQVSFSQGAKTLQLPVDMGFIVFNKQNYPTFNAFLKQLNIEAAKSDMSFAFHDPETGFMYAGTGLRGMLVRKRNLVSPVFWRMLNGIRKFNGEAKRDLDSGSLKGKTIEEYLTEKRYNKSFENNYLLPMAGAIWSAPEKDTHNFPAEALVRFFDNHMLLNHLNLPQWYFVKNGSYSYVQAFERQFSGIIRTGTAVSSVIRTPQAVQLIINEQPEQFDAVVLATHANISLQLLSSPSSQEIALLSPWHYTDNHVVLHTDENFLPPKVAGRASWNFIRDPQQISGDTVGVSYHMNRLQDITAEHEYVVTLNPTREPAPDTLIEDKHFAHPQYSLEAMQTQEGLPSLNGINRTFFCGAYQGYGFHEDGAKSGARVAELFGVSL